LNAGEVPWDASGSLLERAAALRSRRAQLHAIEDPVKRRLEEISCDSDEDALFFEYGGRLAVEAAVSKERNRQRLPVRWTP
jgi:hypothetical protein